MPCASRLTMIPLAALSALVLMPQVTMAASQSQHHHHHHQQQQQQQTTCSNFEFFLPTSKTGLSGPALVTINTSTNTVSVKVYNSNGTSVIATPSATYISGVLTITGASNTFTLSAPTAPIGGIVVVTPTPINSTTPGTPFNVLALCLPGSPTTPPPTTCSITSSTLTLPLALGTLGPNATLAITPTGVTVSGPGSTGVTATYNSINNTITITDASGNTITLTGVPTSVVSGNSYTLGVSGTVIGLPSSVTVTAACQSNG